MCYRNYQKRIVALNEDEVIWKPLERNLADPELLRKPRIGGGGDRNLQEKTNRGAKFTFKVKPESRSLAEVPRGGVFGILSCRRVISNSFH